MVSGGGDQSIPPVRRSLELHAHIPTCTCRGNAVIFAKRERERPDRQTRAHQTRFARLLCEPRVMLDVYYIFPRLISAPIDREVFRHLYVSLSLSFSWFSTCTAAAASRDNKILSSFRHPSHVADCRGSSFFGACYVKRRETIG